MAEPEESRDELELLAEEFTARLRGGERPEIEEYAARHPELAEEIRELFPTIAAIEGVKFRRERTSGGRASLGPARLERLGDFRILREIGRGGMGIVYEAVQESLDRRVAIKVLPRGALLDEEHLRRFELEARIAAGLHHTNIVPVFGVGEQGGFHYFAMQYIEGEGLDRRIAELAGSDAREAERWTLVARVGLQAARALEFAHARGTLHRDVKPSNLLLDAEGTVWISDFGVAKALESEQVTRTGDLTGTLRYIAPERLAGRTDARSDQYSLGLSLYELATLEPAFAETDHSRLIHRITREAPRAPRKLDPRIPRDLETIILKAIARDPGRRYPSAGALADDLQRFLDGLPIAARRTGPVERLWRWSRRNPLAAGLSAAVLLLLVAVAVVSGIGYLQAQRANRLIADALTGEKAQRERAEAVSGLSLEVLDEIYRHLAPQDISSTSEFSVEDSSGKRVEVPLQPVLSRENAALLEKLLAFYDRLAAQSGEDETWMREAALANRRVGAIHLHLGQYEQAESAFRRALKLYDQLHSSFEIACTYNELGAVQSAAGHPEQARRAHREALHLLGDATRGSKSSAARRLERARSLYLLGSQELYRPPEEPARPRHRPGPPPGRPEVRRDVANLMEAIGILEELHREQPRHPGYRQYLARCYRDLPPHGEPSVEVQARYEEAVKLLTELVAEYPDIPEYRHDLCEAHARFFRRDPFAPPELHERAREHLIEGQKIAEELVARRPNIPAYGTALVHIHMRLGEVLRFLDRVRESEAEVRKALELQSALVASFPEAVSYREWHAVIKRSLSALLAQTGRPQEARPLLEEAIAELEDLLATGARGPHLEPLLEACRHELAGL